MISISNISGAIALVASISAGTYAYHDLKTQVANNSRSIAISQYNYWVQLKSQRRLTPDECVAYTLVAKSLGLTVSCN